MKKFIAVLLAFILCTASVSLIAFAKEDEAIPCIIVPGIGQSRTWLVDDYGDYIYNDNGEKIECFPGVIDIDTILENVAAPLAASVAAQKDIGLSEAVCKEVDRAFSMNGTFNNAQPCGRVELESYPFPISKCTEDEKKFIFSCVPMQGLTDTIGEDYLYYYTYNSFGNALDIIDGLYKYIQLVKKQTGCSKVNIIPISMGGAIFNGLMELYPQVANDLHRIIFVIPALDGSTIVSDIYKRELTFLNSEYLYNGFLEELLGEADASAIELAIRILPKDVIMGCLEKAVDTILETTARNCTGLWMLVPNGEYDKCVEMQLSSPDKAEIKRQTDIFHKAQGNSRSNILKFINEGVEVFDIVAYDYALYNIGNSWDTQNADGIIQTASTSMGAKMSKVGEQLPDDYVQQNTYCSNPEHNHISPDRVVDASTGLLPDHTFYFDGQSHAYTADNDIIMKLCSELVESDAITDVYSDPRFPQFNVGRLTYNIRIKLLPAAEAVDRSTLTKADAAELDAAVNAANEMLSRTIAKEGEAPAIEARLRAILEKIGAIEPQSGESALSPAIKKINDLVYKVGGANGYYDIAQNAVNGLFGSSDNGQDKPDEATPGNAGEGSGTNDSGNSTVKPGNGGGSSNSGTDKNENASASSDKNGSVQYVHNPQMGGRSFNELAIAAGAVFIVAVSAILIVIKRKKVQRA